MSGSIRNNMTMRIDTVQKLMRTGHVTFICYCLMVFEFMRFVCGHHSTLFWSREGITRSINNKIPLRSHIRNRSPFIDRLKTDRFALRCRVSIPEIVRLINNRRRIRDRQRNISMIFQSINMLSMRSSPKFPNRELEILKHGFPPSFSVPLHSIHEPNCSTISGLITGVGSATGTEGGEFSSMASKLLPSCKPEQDSFR